MNKGLIIILLLIVSITGKAQNAYIPLNLTQGSYWMSHLKAFDNQTLFCACDILTYYEKDTIINGYTYHKLRNINTSLPSTCPTNIINFKAPSFIREDTTLKMFYNLFSILNGNYGEEPLLNMNLQQNDIVEMCGLFTTIDSITYENYNGINRRTQYFNIATHGQFKTIEGVGSTLNFPICVPPNDLKYYIIELLCFKNNGQVVYSKYPNDSCYTSIPLGLEHQEKEAFSVNYYQNTLSVNDVTSGFNISIFSITGNKIFNIENINTDIKINLAENFCNGMYIVKIYDNEKQQVQKIMVSQ